MAFDIATSTGVAFGLAGKTPRATTIDLGKRGKSEAARFAKAMQVTRHLLEKYEPDHVFYEAAIGGPKASAFLIGLAACVTGTVADMGIPVREARIQSVRKHFLGKHLVAKDFPGLDARAARDAIKQRVIGRCNQLGWRPRSDDEADALAIWDFGCATLRAAQSVPTGGLFGAEHFTERAGK
ncbi:hypothetical protein KM176_16605 [Pseudooceanicola sp. CBS1P-1]|uniref:Uncharacterized protein n=1 Tax=Pseudooceanicola albus TaxID=2692189 RepID=A0A6L7G4Z9_9RHOB|nr:MULTISPECIES: hypothetical protein [Pseudooceanicola]MBT9385497.1 hypothetical protein [Pseudooceanicola endophyticus]MXN19091.1 hypothetical protein [Pseudooceanicola albus]